MVNTIKKLSDIAFQNEAGLGVVTANFPSCILKPLHSFMRTFTKTARERSADESGVKQHIEFVVYGVMKYTVSYYGFVNVSPFWVSYVEPFVRTVSVSFVSQIPMQLKDILLKFPLKAHNITFTGLAPSKLFPRQKQVPYRDYLVV